MERIWRKFGVVLPIEEHHMHAMTIKIPDVERDFDKW